MRPGVCDFSPLNFALPPADSSSPSWPSFAADHQRPPAKATEATMTTHIATLPPRFLRTKEAAAFLSLSARTLEKHRTYGTGPAYRKLGGRVVYSIDELEAWAERGVVTSTSDPRGSVLPAKRQAQPTAALAGRNAR